MPDNEPTPEQRMSSMSNKAHGIADKIESMTDWDGTWTPPEEPPDGRSIEREFTVKEWEAMRRAARSKALSHYNNRGFTPSYMKYNYIYKQLGGDGLTMHHDDPKFLKMVRDGKVSEDMIPDDLDEKYLPID